MTTHPSTPSSRLGTSESAPLTSVPPVAVIIPIYAGLAETQQCIASVFAAPVRTPYTLWLVDDASPEPRLSAWLDSLATENPQIVLLRNPQNLGFVGSVNRALTQIHAQHDHDVVLLNSDTIVSNDWLDRLIAPLRQTQTIGTATAFSNSADLASYPLPFHDNPLATGWTPATLDTLFAQVHPGFWLDAPTGVGFCMAIRQTCLAQVGIFDEAAFGRGYGEETDFCQRAQRAGWRNILCGDIFVYHAGGLSFGVEQNPRKQAAIEILNQRYPNFLFEVARFRQMPQLKQWANLNILAQLRCATRPVLAYVTHTLGGGVAHHITQLQDTVGRDATILTLAATPQFVEIRSLDPQYPLELNIPIAHAQTALPSFLHTVDVTHLHVHHTLGWPNWIETLHLTLKVPLLVTLHDYSTICPQITLTDAQGRYCREPDALGCAQCLTARPAPSRETIAQWRARHQAWLKTAKWVLTPSADTETRMLRYFPQQHFARAGHAQLEAALPTPAVSTRRVPGSPLRIGLIGRLVPAKGLAVLEACAIQADPKMLHFILIGSPERALHRRALRCITQTGPYPPQDLDQHIQAQQLDLVWFPAQWPETYSYTLSAALQHQLPIVATNLGVFPERLQGHGNARCLPWDTPPADWNAFFLTEANALRTQANSAPRSPSRDTTVLHESPVSVQRPGLTALQGIDWSHWQTNMASWHPSIPSRQGPRQTALRLLYRLRASSALSSFTQRIPRHWQRHIRLWLSR